MSYKLNLGSGDVRIDGYINVDLYDETADIQADICDIPLPDGCAEKIVCYQVIEHVPYNKNEALFNELYRLLKHDGEVIIETPDIDVVARKILEEGLEDKWVYNLVGEYYRPWDKDRYQDWEHNAASIHRNPWNYKRLVMFATKAGFTRITRRPQADYYPCEENLTVSLQK